MNSLEYSYSQHERLKGHNEMTAQSTPDTISVNRAFHSLFNRAMMNLQLSQEMDSEKIGEFIDLAFNVANHYIPQLTNLGIPSTHRYQKRRLLALASHYWLKQEERMDMGVAR
jgi:hypothetical protein